MSSAFPAFNSSALPAISSEACLTSKPNSLPAIWHDDTCLLQKDLAKLSRESEHMQRGFWQICAHEGRQQALSSAAQALEDAQSEKLALQTIQSEFAKNKKRIEIMFGGSMRNGPVSKDMLAALPFLPSLKTLNSFRRIVIWRSWPFYR